MFVFVLMIKMEIRAPSEVYEENCPSERDNDNGNSNTQMEETSPSERDTGNGNSDTEIEENCPRDIDNGNSNTQIEENCPSKEDIDGNSSTQTEENCPSEEDIDNGYLKAQIERQLLLVEKQHIQIQVLSLIDHKYPSRNEITPLAGSCSIYIGTEVHSSSYKRRPELPAKPVHRGSQQPGY